MVISKGEAGHKMREEAGIIGIVLFLKLNCGSYTLVLKFMSVHFLIMLYNLYIHYIINILPL